MNYRKGVFADLEQLRELGLKSYGQFETVLGEEGWKKMAAGLGNENTYRDLLNVAQCFVCEGPDKKLAGMAFLVPRGHPFAFFEAGWAYIRLVGVDPSCEGQGIGRTLTRLCVDFARESGENLLALHTSEFQNAARHIYESMGFKKVRELDANFGKKYWLYHLVLQDNHY